MRYNVHHSRSHFRLGTRIKVLQCSGLDSGKTGTVVNHFDWRKEEGAYSAPGKEQVPVKYDDGKYSYMWKSRLKIVH